MTGAGRARFGCCWRGAGTSGGAIEGCCREVAACCWDGWRGGRTLNRSRHRCDLRFAAGETIHSCIDRWCVLDATAALLQPAVAAMPLGAP